MATTTASSPPLFDRAVFKPLSGLATVGMVAIVGLLITVKFPAATPLAAFITLIIFLVAGWMLVSERYELSLAVLMLYLGVADGFLKLKTGSSHATLVRDILLYSITIGAVIRLAVRGETIRWPPLSGWVLAWVIVVAIQVANPENGTLSHSIVSMRQHAEWIPLFFLAYFVVRSRARLRAFLLILLVIAAANGVVGLIQENLTPSQLYGWGPGYARAITGEESEGGISSRTYADNEGTERVRPFGLGGDFGFGGIVGLIAVPAALGLMALSRRRGVRIVTALLSVGVVMAVVTSEARTAVLGAIIALFAFAALTVTSRAGLRTVMALALTVIVGYATVGLLAKHSEKGSFDRYDTISNPGLAVSTAYNYRTSNFKLIPEYAKDFPLGAGIGSLGPATSFGGGPPDRKLSGESEPTFLLIELGIPGLIVMLGFNLTLFFYSVTRIRKIEDRETRILLTAVAAPLFAIFFTWWVGSTTATTPAAPYLWFAAGVLSFWLLGEGQGSLEPSKELERPARTAHLRQA